MKKNPIVNRLGSLVRNESLSSLNKRDSIMLPTNTPKLVIPMHNK